MSALAIIRAAGTVAKVVKNVGKAKQAVSTAVEVFRPQRKSKNRQSKGLSKIVAAPISISHLSQARVGALADVSVPFSGMDITIVPHAGLTSSTSLDFTDLSVRATGLDLQPSPNYVGGGTAMPICGISISQLATCFSQYRFKSLVVDYIATRPTSEPGLICFGATSDPFDVMPTSYVQVASCASNIVTSLWSSARLNLTPLVSGKNSRLPWYLTRRSENTAAESQLCAAGSMQGYLLGGPDIYSSGSTIGVLRFSGVIEFRGLSRVDLIGSSPSVPVKADTTECKSNDSHETSVVISASTPLPAVQARLDYANTVHDNSPSDYFHVPCVAEPYRPLRPAVLGTRVG